jgi:hypothetical protein
VVRCWERIGDEGEDGGNCGWGGGRKSSSWEEEQGIVAQDRESEEGKYRDKRIVMVKLIMQEK